MKAIKSIGFFVGAMVLLCVGWVLGFLADVFARASNWVGRSYLQLMNAWK